MAVQGLTTILTRHRSGLPRGYVRQAPASILLSTPSPTASGSSLLCFDAFCRALAFFRPSWSSFQHKRLGNKGLKPVRLAQKRLFYGSKRLQVNTGPAWLTGGGRWVPQAPCAPRPLARGPWAHIPGSAAGAQPRYLAAASSQPRCSKPADGAKRRRWKPMKAELSCLNRVNQWRKRQGEKSVPLTHPPVEESDPADHHG